MNQENKNESERIRDVIIDEYGLLTPKSKEFFERSENSLVAGVTGNLRFFKPYPLYFSAGQGSRITDIDGNDYIDCFLCNGPLQLGHRPDRVLESIRQHESMGALVVNPMLATEVAERLIDIVPCAERVRFVTSGTEAVMTAIRCARAATGRNKVIKFLGHYHGQSDQFLVGMGQAPVTVGDGISQSSIADTRLLPYGDIDALRQAIEQDNDIAAVLLDPAMHAGGLWGSQKKYLDEVRDITQKHGVLLIFDEVITGFRLALGGAQQLYDVTPDLATFAKALCAGEKLGAIVGRKEIMDVLDPRRGRGEPGIFQSGTTNDGTDALAATLAALDEYVKIDSENGFTRLTELTEKLTQGLSDLFNSYNVPCHINQLGPMLQMYLAQQDEPSFESYGSVDGRPLYLFTLALLSEGVLFSLPGSTHVYISFCHSDEDIKEILQATKNVLEKYDFSCLVNNARKFS
ncbi:MAG: glutamate-1-semialdehyde 2,1-aminomutase [Parasphingorhabdus sp.]